MFRGDKLNRTTRRASRPPRSTALARLGDPLAVAWLWLRGGDAKSEALDHDPHGSSDPSSHFGRRRLAFDSTADVDSLLDRIGAISTLTDTRYWSVTDKAWKSLFERATALTGPASDQPRRDFTAAELRDGHDHHFLEKDNRLGAAVIERLTVLTAADDRIVFETVNVTPVKFLLVTVYPPGTFHTIYFPSRRAATRWNFYSLQYAGSDRSLLTASSTGFLY